MAAIPEKSPVCLAAQLQMEHCEFVPVAEKLGSFERAKRALSRYYLPGKTRKIPDYPRCVVITTGGNLGGAILSSPLIRAVRERFPDTHLTVVSNTAVGREFMEFFGVGDSFYTIEGFGVGDGIFTVGGSTSRSSRKYIDYLSTLVRIARRRPELLIGNYNGQIEHLLIPLRIPVRVGHSGTNLVGHPLAWSSMFNVPVAIHRGMNWLETYRLLSERVGAAFPGVPSVTVPRRLRDWAGAELTQLGLEEDEACLAVQIGVWQPQAWKQWPVARLAELCRMLWKTHRIRAVLLGDRSGRRSLEEFRSVARDVPSVSLVGSTTVAQAAAILSRCRASVCNDSGLMHLSAAVGTPTVAIYGMTDPAKTWCYSPPHRMVRQEDCVPCYNLDSRILARCEHKGCLSQLEADRVYRAVVEVVHRANGLPSLLSRVISNR